MTTQTVLDPKVEVPAPFSKVQAALAKMEAENANLAIDYQTPEGQKTARSQIRSLQLINGDIDRTHKEVKAEALKACQVADELRRNCRERVAEMIAVHKEPLDRIKAEEEARLQRIQDKIDNISQTSINLANDPTSAEIEEAIKSVSSLAITEEIFQERFEEATARKDEELADLNRALVKRKSYEAEQAELARLRAEREEQDRKAREAEIARQAEERARREEQQRAENERKAAEARLQAEREATARREREAEEKAQREREAAAEREREAERRAAQAKADAEAAELRAQNAAREERERIEREQREAAEAAKRAEAERVANEKHVAKVNAAAIKELCHFITEGDAKKVVAVIADGRIPNITITY